MQQLIITLVIFFASLSIHSCGDPPVMKPREIGTDSSYIGPNGPAPLPGWKADTLRGTLDNSNYFNTSGDWYVIIENNALLNNEFTQLYLSPNTYNDNGQMQWMHWRKHRVSGKFLYLDDPSRSYRYWSYIIFVYRRSYL